MLAVNLAKVRFLSSTCKDLFLLRLELVRISAFSKGVDRGKAANQSDRVQIVPFCSGRAFITERGFVATRQGLEALTAQLHREAITRGLGQAQQVLVIADGAVWIWNLVKDRFPKPINAWISTMPRNISGLWQTIAMDVALPKRPPGWRPCFNRSAMTKLALLLLVSGNLNPAWSKPNKRSFRPRSNTLRTTSTG